MLTFIYILNQNAFEITSQSIHEKKKRIFQTLLTSTLINIVEFVVAVCKKPTNSGELQIDQLVTSIRRMTLIVLL